MSEIVLCVLRCPRADRQAATRCSRGYMRSLHHAACVHQIFTPFSRRLNIKYLSRLRHTSSRQIIRQRVMRSRGRRSPATLWRSPYDSTTSRVKTVKPVMSATPKLVERATSVASRPWAIRMRPMRGLLCRASKVCQRPSR